MVACNIARDVISGSEDKHAGSVLWLLFKSVDPAVRVQIRTLIMWIVKIEQIVIFLFGSYF